MNEIRGRGRRKGRRGERERYVILTLVAKRAQMLDGELQDLRFLQLSAVRVPRRRRNQPPQLAEGRVDSVAALLLYHPPSAFPRRVLTGVSAGRVASANGNFADEQGGREREREGVKTRQKRRSGESLGLMTRPRESLTSPLGAPRARNRDSESLRVYC